MLGNSIESPVRTRLAISSLVERFLELMPMVAANEQTPNKAGKGARRTRSQ